jgi:hypothetical protein
MEFEKTETIPLPTPEAALFNKLPPAFPIVLPAFFVVEP